MDSGRGDDRLEVAREGSQKPAHWIAVIWIVVAVTAAFANSLMTPFVFDDKLRIVEDPMIRVVWPPWTAMSQSNRPFADYTFAINYWLGGFDTRGYHLVNLVIHLVATLCLYGIVRRTCRRIGGRYRAYAEPVGVLAACLWGVHPLQTESVTYIVQRLESLMGMAYLATLLCLIRGAEARPGRAWGWYALSVVFCGFGMGCKEVMVTAPVMMLWYDRVFLSNSWRSLFAERGNYYLALAATWFVLAWSMLHFQGDYGNGALLVVPGVDSWTYLISQSVAITHYLRLSFWPDALCIHYNQPFPTSIMETWPYTLLITSLVGVTTVSVFRWPKLGFLGAWLFVILSPTSSIVPIQDMLFEHRMYLPLAAIAVLVAVVWLEIFARTTWLASYGRLGFLLSAVPLVGALGIATYQRNQVYASHIALWDDTVRKAPHNPSAWSNLGSAFADKKLLAQARDSFLKSVELDPTQAKTLASLGGMELELGEFEQAEQHLLAALRIDPDNELALMNLGNLRLDQGLHAEAIDYLQRVLPIAEKPNEIRLSLSAAMLQMGMFDEAIKQCEALLEQEPNSVEARVNMACALAATGRQTQAIEQCEAAIAIDPNSPNAYGTLALLNQAIDPELAQRQLARALELDPQSADFNFAMGELLFARDPQAAVPYYQTAVAQRADDVAARFKLAVALDMSGEPESAVSHMEKVVRLLPGSQEAVDCLNALRIKIENSQTEQR